MNTSNERKTRNIIPYHLIIIAILPVVSLYAHNIEQVAFINTLRAYGVFLSVGAVSFVLAYVFVRNIHYAALITSCGLGFFFVAIPLQSLLIDAGIEGISRMRYLLSLLGIAFIAGIWRIKRITRPSQATGMVNWIALSTLILPLFQIGNYLVAFGAAQTPHPLDAGVLTLNTNVTPLRPDVYLIVLDGHGRSDDIKRTFGYDNSADLGKLEEMGFYVAQCSRANYPDATWQSMYATLNMRFFDHEMTKEQSQALTRNEGFIGIKKNAVRNIFSKLGYQFVSFNTGYDFLNITDADVYYDFSYFPGTTIKLLNKFESMLLTNTLLSPLVNQTVSKQRVHYENILRILDQLSSIPMEVSSPKFVYAHIMVPHFPYVFLSDGEYRAEDQDEFTPQKYIDQIKFIDREIVLIVRQIIENSDTPPIIIIQGDHGFSVEPYMQLDDDKDRAQILNAYYLPDINYSEEIAPDISPVNSFRLIFNLYFDGNMAFMPNHIYRDNLESDLKHNQLNIPYEFIEDKNPDTCLVVQ